MISQVSKPKATQPNVKQKGKLIQLSIRGLLYKHNNLLYKHNNYRKQTIIDREELTSKYGDDNLPSILPRESDKDSRESDNRETI